MEKTAVLLTDFIPAASRILIFVQVLAILLVALVAGATFGIWQGYNPSYYSAATFLEVHQNAVRGLNFLLPAIALVAVMLTALLSVRSYATAGALPIYAAALVLLIAGGLITRFVNQPINAQVMTWTSDTIPGNWNELRDAWWFWHVARTATAALALITLVTATLVERAN